MDIQDLHIASMDIKEIDLPVDCKSLVKDYIWSAIGRPTLYFAVSLVEFSAFVLTDHLVSQSRERRMCETDPRMATNVRLCPVHTNQEYKV